VTHKQKGGAIANYLDIAHASAELAVIVGIIEGTMEAGEGQWPDEVKENFEEKVETLVEALQNEIVEFIEFGRALDADEDS
jgi:TRAP-type uncharacterized transport system substrate-binding protein